MKKLGIIGGAGGLGSTMAFYLGLRDVFEEIALVDVKENCLATHLIDLTECFSEECSTRITGGWDNMTNCDMVIMAASITGHKVESRSDYLAANIKLIRETAARIKETSPDAVLVSTTSPVDVFAMVFRDELGWDRHRILGFSRNDSQRFRWAVSHVLGVDGRRVGGFVMGEHGETQVPIFSSVTLDGKKAKLGADQIAAVQKILDDWYGIWQGYDSGRTTTWTSATSIYHMLATLAGKTRDKSTMGSVFLEGEYGISGVSLGAPIMCGQRGWAEVIERKLTEDELKGVQASARQVKGLYDSLA